MCKYFTLPFKVCPTYGKERVFQFYSKNKTFPHRHTELIFPNNENKQHTSKLIFESKYEAISLFLKIKNNSTKWYPRQFSKFFTKMKRSSLIPMIYFWRDKNKKKENKNEDIWKIMGLVRAPMVCLSIQLCSKIKNFLFWIKGKSSLLQTHKDQQEKTIKQSFLFSLIRWQNISNKNQFQALLL